MNQTIAIVTVTAHQLQELIETAVSRAVERALISAQRFPVISPTESDLHRVWPERMNRDQAAEYLGVAASSLSVDVCRRRWKVPFLRIGRRIVYEKCALDRWMAEHRNES